MSFPWFPSRHFRKPKSARLLGAYCLWRASVKSWPFFAATTWEKPMHGNYHVTPASQFLRWHVSVSNINEIHDIFHGFLKTSRSNKSACPGSFNESIIIGDLAVLYMCRTNAKRHYVYKNLHYLRMWYMQITIHLYIYTHIHINRYTYIIISGKCLYVDIRCRKVPNTRDLSFCRISMMAAKGLTTSEEKTTCGCFHSVLSRIVTLP